MEKVINAVRWCANSILSIGLIGIFSEGSSFLPNLVGLGCFALLILINKNRTT